MILDLAPAVLLAFTAVMLLAGIINGVAGFGFALVGTMALASRIDPSTAVVFMIIPILSVNLSLARDLSATDLRSCGRRFLPVFVTAALGTVLGMVVLEEVPAGPLRVGLGVVTLAFVATSQTLVTIPGVDWVKQRCFIETRWMMGVIGAVSGLVFGGTNVGVQLIAYFKSQNLSHGLFVSVVAIVFLGLNGIRVVVAGVLGLYPSQTVVLASLAAAVPAVVGVVIGKRLQTAITETYRDRFVLVLLTGIGLRLLQVGL